MVICPTPFSLPLYRVMGSLWRTFFFLCVRHFRRYETIHNITTFLEEEGPHSINRRILVWHCLDLGVILRELLLNPIVAYMRPSVNFSPHKSPFPQEDVGVKEDSSLMITDTLDSPPAVDKSGPFIGVSRGGGVRGS